MWSGLRLWNVLKRDIPFLGHSMLILILIFSVDVSNKFDAAMDFNVWQSNLAEVMIDIIADDGCIMNFSSGVEGGDMVFGHCSAECVAKFIGCLANFG